MNSLIYITLYRHFGHTFATLLSRLITTLEPVALKEPRLHQLLEEVRSVLNLLRRVLNRDRASALTARIAETDDLRDDLQESFALAIESFMKWRTQPERVEHATVINGAIEKIGRGKSRRYDEQSAQIEQLLLELSAVERVGAIAALNLDDLVADLRRTQKAFHELWTQRNQEDALAEELPRRAAVVEQGVKLANRMLGYIYSVAAFDKEMAAAAKAVSAMIDEAEARQRVRIDTGEEETQEQTAQS
jgi:hypothetical protein